MTPNPERLDALRAQAARALADLRNLREREARVLSDRRGMMPNDDRLPHLDASHLRLVKEIRDCESVLARLQAEIAELETAQRAADAKEAAAQRATAETEIAAAVEQRLRAAARIDAAAAALVAAFRDLDEAGNVLARHENVHGRTSQVIFSGRPLRAALIAAAGDTALARALELKRAYDGAMPALENEIDLWRKYVPENPKAA